MNYSSCAPSSTRDVYFGSRVSLVIIVPDHSFSDLDLGSYVPCKISVPGVGSRVLLLESRVSDLEFHLWIGCWVSRLASLLPSLRSQVLGSGSHPHDRSRVSGLTFRISQNLLARKDESFFNDQMRKIYIFIHIFGNKIISGTLLKLPLSLVTSLIFSFPYAWKTQFFKYVLNLEAAARGVIWINVSLEISQNLQENPCVRVTFLIKLQAGACCFI